MRWIGSCAVLLGAFEALMFVGVAQGGGTALTTELVANVNLPVLVTHAPGDYDRLFVIARAEGKVLIVKNGLLLLIADGVRLRPGLGVDRDPAK